MTPFINFLSLDQQKRVEKLLKKYPQGHEKAAMREVLFSLLSADMDATRMEEIIKAVSYRCGVSPRFLAEIIRNDLGCRKQENVSVYEVQVCTSLPCLLRGGGEVMKACEKWLGLSCGSKTIDGRFSLRKKTCVNECTQGPVVKINQHQKEDLTPTKIIFWLQSLSGEEKPSSLKPTTIVHNPYGFSEDLE